MKRRFLLCILVVLCITIGALAFNASAATIVDSGTCGANLNWTLDSDGVLTISGSGEMGDFYYDDDIPWYSDKSQIKSVVIENGVTTIGDDAFSYCPNLTTVTFGNNIESIGSAAFFGCDSLESVTIPISVETIGNDVFKNCTNLSSVTIQNSAATIGLGAFSECSSLKAAELGNAINHIGDYAFYRCVSLESIVIPGSVALVKPHSGAAQA